MKTKRWILAMAAALSLLVCGGCAVLLVGGAVAAGAGTVVYVKGELQATVDGTMEQVWAAARAGLKDLQMPVTGEQKDALNGQFIARAAGDKKVTVRVKKVTGTSTELGIRVGLWGEEAMSHEILDKIKKHL
jgi:hypothetical protein